MNPLRKVWKWIDGWTWYSDRFTPVSYSGYPKMLKRMRDYEVRWL